jgi:murein DD-endopeptidase MepM/ murein hydrolase activator NlpD
MIIRTAIGAIAGLLMTTAPAYANDETAGSQMTGIIDIDNVAESGTKDAEFTQLFASWEALDEGGVVNAQGEILAPPTATVSVPSLMPVEGARMSSGYGMRDHPILRKRKNHNGIDLAVARGTPVYATADGHVAKAKYWGSYGNYVQIEHGGDLHTRFAHLSSYTVSAGDEVRKGDLIGYVGSTGRSTGPHLHYEVRVAGEAVDPRPYMIGELASVQDGSAGIGGD